MIRGQDITIGGDDDAGTEALFFARALTVIALGLLVTEKLAEDWVVHHRIPRRAFFDEPRGVNVDDAGRNFFDDGRVARGGPRIAVDGRAGNREGR